MAEAAAYSALLRHPADEPGYPFGSLRWSTQRCLKGTVCCRYLTLGWP